MSVNGDRNLDKKSKKRRVEQRFTTVADWAGVDRELLVTAIAAVTLGGGAIRFGYTRDGGAFAIGIYDGDDKYTLFAKPEPSGELDITLQDIINGFSDEGAPAAKKRT